MQNNNYFPQSTDAWQTINNAKSITLLGHIKPDPDALGACGALAETLEAAGKKVEIIYPGHGRDPFPFPLNTLRENHHTFIPDLIISCDTPDPRRLYLPQEFAGITHIAIDHHQNHTISALFSFVDTTSTSSCELVYRLLMDWQRAITPMMADQLLFGIMCDTLNFKVPGTSAATFRVAADLIDKGANLPKLNNALILHKNPAVLTLWGTLLQSATYNQDKTALWIVCSAAQLKKHHLDVEALNGFIGTITQTISTDVIALFYEYDGKTKASLRAKKTNVCQIAHLFGGGGHTLAAGLTSTLPLEQLVAEVTKHF